MAWRSWMDATGRRHVARLETIRNRQLVRIGERELEQAVRFAEEEEEARRLVEEINPDDLEEINLNDWIQDVGGRAINHAQQIFGNVREGVRDAVIREIFGINNEVRELVHPILEELFGPAEENEPLPEEIYNWWSALSPYMASSNTNETHQALTGAAGASGANTGPGAASGSPGLMMWRSVESVTNGVIEITNTHLFASWGIQHSWYEDGKIGTGTKPLGRRIVTSAATWMLDALPLFMSKGQFDALPKCCYMTECSVTLIPVGLEASFSTGSTVAGNGSLTHVPFIIANKNGLTYMAWEPVKVLTGADMKQTSITPILDFDDIELMMWGDNSASAFPSSSTVLRNWHYYDSWKVPTKGNSTETKNAFPANYDLGCPALNKVYSQGVAQPIVDARKPFHYSYKPMVGVLKTMVDYMHPYMSENHACYSGTDTLINYYSLIGGDYDCTNLQTLKPMYLQNGLHNDYHQCVEKAGVCNLLSSRNRVSVPGNLSVGINPVPNNVPNTENSFVNAKIIFLMVTNCKVAMDFSTFSNQVQCISHEKMWFVNDGATGGFKYAPGGSRMGAGVPVSGNYYGEKDGDSFKGKEVESKANIESATETPAQTAGDRLRDVVYKQKNAGSQPATPQETLNTKPGQRGNTQGAKRKFKGKSARLERDIEDVELIGEINSDEEDL